MRTIVDLPEDQLEALSVFCKHEHISRAEAIRRAVSHLLGQKTEAHAAFGLWKKRKFNARHHVEKLRSEWDRK